MAASLIPIFTHFVVVVDNEPTILSSSSLRCNPSSICRRRRSLSVRSSRGGGGFVGGFLLGGILAGTLSCIYAPQISEALMGATSNGPKKKLPEFAHDKEEEEDDDELGNDPNDNMPKVANDEEITRESIAAKIAEINAMMGNSSNPRYT